MSESTIRFLQQENSRLQRDNEALNQKNIALIRHLNMVEELYWIAQTIETEEEPLAVLDEGIGQAIFNKIQSFYS